MRTITSLSFTALSTSQPRPHFSRVPGWKFSTSTSACLTSRFSSSAPAPLRRSSVADFLLRHSCSQASESPLSVMVPNLRSASPTFGSSSLMTSAPNSASWVAQKGPARKLDTSMMRMPCRGLAVCCGAGASVMAEVPVAGFACPLGACGDALDCRQHAARPIDDGIVDELAFELDGGGAGRFGRLEGAHDLARPLDLRGRGREDRVDLGHLIGVDAHLALKPEALDVAGRRAQALDIGEINPHRVERRLDAGSTRGEHALAAVGQELSLAAAPLDIHVEGEIAGAEGDALDARRGGRDGANVGHSLAGLDDGDDVELTGCEPPLPLQVRNHPIDGSDLVGRLHLGQDDAVDALRDDRHDVAVAELGGGGIDADVAAALARALAGG